MRLSHSVPTLARNTGLSGSDALRAHFGSRQVLKLKEAAQCIGQSYSHFYRRVQAGTLDLKIRKNEIGERFVLLDDLIFYLFSGSGTDSASSSPKTTKRGPGRPRKALSGQEGGAR